MSMSNPSESNDSEQSNPQRNHRQDTEPLHEEWVTYGLPPHDIPSFLFGRLSGKARSPTDPDFILDNNRSKISAKQFRLHFNENRVWMLEDLSRHGCKVNGRPLSRGSSTTMIALNPQEPNVIDLPDLQLEIEVGHARPSFHATPQHLDMSGLDIESRDATESTFSSTKTSLSQQTQQLFDYYELLPYTRDHFLLMDITDGQRYLGYPYHDIDTAQDNLTALQAIFELGADFGILPLVKLISYKDHFMALTKLPSGIPLCEADYDLNELSYVMVQVLEKLAFLHFQQITHGNISATTIMVLSDQAVTTELAGIALDQPKIDENHGDDILALGRVVRDALESINIDWQKTPLEPYLTACLSQPQKVSAKHLLEQMQIDEPGSTSLPFDRGVSIRRHFRILCLERNGQVLQRLLDLHRIIHSAGRPRTPSVADSLDHDDGQYITSKVAEALLRKHHLQPFWVTPRSLNGTESFSGRYTVRKSIHRHTASGMCNISQILELVPDFDAAMDLPQPVCIQEVRGHSKTNGYYISRASFEASVRHIQKAGFDIDIEYSSTSPLLTEKPTRFEVNDFHECVLIPTECAVPQFVKVRRCNHTSSDVKDHLFSSPAECHRWLVDSGLSKQNMHVCELQQPISPEWRTVPSIEGIVDDPILLTPASSSIARFGTRRATRTKAVVNDSSSGDENDASNVILAPDSDMTYMAEGDSVQPTSTYCKGDIVEEYQGANASGDRRRKVGQSHKRSKVDTIVVDGAPIRSKLRISTRKYI